MFHMHHIEPCDVHKCRCAFRRLSSVQLPHTALDNMQLRRIGTHPLNVQQATDVDTYGNSQRNVGGTLRLVRLQAEGIANQRCCRRTLTWETCTCLTMGFAGHRSSSLRAERSTGH